MNEHKVTKPFLLQKQGKEWVRIEIPRQTDIDVVAKVVTETKMLEKK